MQLIKVKFLKSGEPSGKAYTYFSEQPVEVNDKVQINSVSVGIVTEVNVPEEEIAAYKDKVKSILGKYEDSSEEENCVNAEKREGFMFGPDGDESYDEEEDF